MLLDERIQEILSEGSFLRFDRFVIEQMGYTLTKEDDEQIRHQAFLEFRKRTGRRDIATMPTMRRWFGIGTYRRPAREKVYEICFALQLPKEEAAVWFTKGLGEPSFQINDYQEMIFLYGLENGLAYETCEKMIEAFETNMNQDISFGHTRSTKELMAQYEISKNKNQEEFLSWMCERMDWFKGYSKTMLDYLGRIRSCIIREIRESAKIRLGDMLKECGYYQWLAKNKKENQTEKEQIYRFIKADKKYSNVSENLRDNILELSHLAFGEKEPNKRVLEAVYSGDEKLSFGRGRHMDEFVCVMTEKHLSDLFNMPEKREQMIRAKQISCALSDIKEESSCPAWVEEFCGNTFDNAGEAAKAVQDFMKEHKRRCLQLQRTDFLPMIFYVAQNQYLAKNQNEYKREEAKNMFIDMANATLNACNMEPINEQFKLDRLLLECFFPQEMYSYSELLDRYYKRGTE